MTDHETSAQLLGAIGNIRNAAQPLPWLVTSGQPSAADLAAARAAGLGAIIDIRDPMEPRPFDEPAVAQQLGLSYSNIPVVAGALSDELMARVLAALRQHAGSTTILHCASANRVGGPLIAYLMLDQGMDEAVAVNTAMRGGLRSAELMEWGVEYARHHPPHPGTM